MKTSFVGDTIVTGGVSRNFYWLVCDGVERLVPSQQVDVPATLTITVEDFSERGEFLLRTHSGDFLYASGTQFPATVDDATTATALAARIDVIPTVSAVAVANEITVTSNQCLRAYVKSGVGYSVSTEALAMPTFVVPAP